MLEISSVSFQGLKMVHDNPVKLVVLLLKVFIVVHDVGWVGRRLRRWDIGFKHRCGTGLCNQKSKRLSHFDPTYCDDHNHSIILSCNNTMTDVLAHAHTYVNTH